ncbi:MAG: sensor histidine kinase [Clostridiales bacterium]|nr:sensor histidine kinase [Clostridiales bacterium]MDU3242720.1 sensor histidine kinase [Clostridiales bacterium]
MKISEQQLEEKYQIEQQLQEEQIKNAQMQTLLSLSELEYLLMQINPHFLYNTLNSISALTIIEDAPKSKEMIDSLSGLLRNSLSVLHDTVPLQVEIETIKNYLNIQKVRFGSRLGYQIDVPDDCLNETIPAMILQPLVENAIVHGLELKTDCGTLKIGACKQAGSLVLTVQDDGVGIEPRTLEKMQTPPDDGTYDFRSGIGIPNVKRRLFLLYNKDVLQIESTLGSGTFITITLPDL